MAEMTMGNLLRRIAKYYAKNEALIFEGERYTYDDFNSRVNMLANGLRDIGIGYGDKVAILSRNCNEYLETYFACAKLGAVMVPLNYRLAPNEIQFLCNQSDAKILLIEGYYQGLLSQVIDGFLFINKDFIIVIDGKAEKSGGISYETFIGKYPSTEPGIEVDPGDPVLLLYTSGTTGRPKGALLTHTNNIWDATAYLYHFELRRGDKLLQGMPFTHVGGLHNLTSGALYKGLPIVIMRTWDPGKACELIQQERCTCAYILVTPLQILLNYPDINKYDFSSLRFILSAAAKYTREMVYQTMYKLKVDAFYFGYGLTEACPNVTITECTGEVIEKENTLGRPNWYVDVRIVDKEGKDVPDGQVGELLVKGPNIFKGYYKNEEATNEALKDGWLYTGDLVYKDKDGFLFLVDRKKDMIKSGNENVYAVEVEMAILKSNPKVAEVAVIGVPDEQWGEAVKACIVPKPGENVSPEEIIQNCRQYIGGFKAPKFVEIMTELPKNVSGKVLKWKLRNRQTTR